MNHENLVAVGVDGSVPSIAAVEWGFEQALRRKAELQLVCVYDLPYYAAHNFPIGAPDVSHEGALIRAAAEKMINDLAAKYKDRGLVVSTKLIEGDPTEELVQLSKQAALLVVGGRVNRQGRISDRILHTVSTMLPAHACCPTVVVGADTLTGHLPVRKIAVGVDGSESAKMALQRAVWEADRWGAELLVVSTVNVDSVSWVPQFTLSKEFYDDLHAGIQRQISEVDEGRDVKISINVTQGNPVNVLADVSKEVDLLVLGTRGRGGFIGMLLGSTSQAIMELAQCPAFLVPRRVREGDDVAPQYLNQW
ncbi:universal stress protein [Arcanobacterium hippocoleae]|uniref:universal stress protein n=1 Tax=Arcanobacterium hippocoleae TaxID=149017 RepID=UPI00333F7E1D